jgi:hypothetical protein
VCFVLFHFSRMGGPVEKFVTRHVNISMQTFLSNF